MSLNECVATVRRSFWSHLLAAPLLSSMGDMKGLAAALTICQCSPYKHPTNLTRTFTMSDLNAVAVIIG